MEGIWISGFADEISSDFDQQLATVTKLGMRYISLRSADGKNMADYTPEEAAEHLLPRLNAAGVGVSPLGSPIGKIGVDDAEAYEKQLGQLDRLCKLCELLDCHYIRIFSFFIPEGAAPDRWQDVVIEKLKGFEAVARKHDVILLHENEKDIYSDVADRCLTLLNAVDSPHLRAVFDFANFVQRREDPVRAWELLHDHVAYIHIKDAVSGSNENVACGTGEGHIAELLKRAIREEGYQGFLTLEPHLVLFDSLQSLEQKAASDVIKENKAKDGADGYRMQYEALQEILGGTKLSASPFSINILKGAKSNGQKNSIWDRRHRRAGRYLCGISHPARAVSQVLLSRNARPTARWGPCVTPTRKKKKCARKSTLGSLSSRTGRKW